MPKFRNDSKKELFVPKYGKRAKPGEVVEFPEGFHNANFTRVETEAEKAKPNVTSISAKESEIINNKNKQNE